MKTVTMTFEVDVHDENQLIDFAKNLYNEDFDKETERYDLNKKIIRSVFEVLIGSAPLPYEYSDAGIEIVGWSD